MDPLSFISSVITDSGNSESSEPPTSLADSLSGGSNQIQVIPTQQQQQTAVEMGHSRNSSNTSQVSEPFFYNRNFVFFKIFIFFFRCPKVPVTVVFHIVNILDKVQKEIQVIRGMLKFERKFKRRKLFANKQKKKLIFLLTKMFYIKI